MKIREKYEVNTVSEMYIRNVIVNYIIGIIDDYEKNISRLDDYVDELRINDLIVLDYLETTALEYKADGKIVEFISQRFMNEIYKNFMDTLPDIDGCISQLRDILDAPEKLLYSRLDEFKKEFCPATVTMTILGARVEHKVDETFDDIDEDQTKEYDKVFIYLKHKMTIYRLEAFCQEFGEGSYGTCIIRKVSSQIIHEKTRNMLPTMDNKVEIPFMLVCDLEEKREDEWVDVFDYIEQPDGYYDGKIFTLSDILTVSDVGGDQYYPNGHMEYDLDTKFSLPVREFSSVPVWIFKGDSGSGKTFLSTMLKPHMELFDTDKHDTLPDEIVADIVVIGNKHGYEVKDIEDRLKFNHNTILVDFNMI